MTPPPAPDVEGFPDRLLEVVPALADMGGVDASVPAHDLAQRGQLGLVGVAARGVLQAGGHSKRARRHRLVDERPHRVKLLIGGRPSVVAHRRDADGPVRHERRDVHGLPPGEECVEVLAEGRPVEVDAPVVVDPDGHLLGQNSASGAGAGPCPQLPITEAVSPCRMPLWASPST